MKQNEKQNEKQDENQETDKKTLSHGTLPSVTPAKKTKKDNPYLWLDSEIIISDGVSLFGAKQEL